MATGSQQDVSDLLRSLTSYPSAYRAPATQYRVESLPHSGLLPEQQSQYVQAQGADQKAPPIDYSQLLQYGYGAGSEHAHSTCGSTISLNPQHAPPPAATSISHTPEPQGRQPAPSTPLPTAVKKVPVTDPRTITTWSAGLRHVTTLLAHNPSMVDGIKKMILNQHENEKSWWASRQALLRQQEQRETGQKKLDDVLRSVGAQTSAAPQLMDPVAELQRYDAKVHAAAEKMAETMASELQTMGIPFFGVKAELITDAPQDRFSGGLDVNDSANGGEVAREPVSLNRSDRISKRELLELQRKMVALLEDYCQD